MRTGNHKTHLSAVADVHWLGEGKIHAETVRAVLPVGRLASEPEIVVNCVPALVPIDANGTAPANVITIETTEIE